LENPYDMTARNNAVERTHEWGYNGNNYLWWDSCFYEGKFYVYFGAVPVVLLYLPYHLLTGGDLSNAAVSFIASYLSVLGIFYLLFQIIKKKFKNTKLWQYWALCLICILCSGTIYLTSSPIIYNIAIASGICFAIWGFALWLRALKENGSIDWRFATAGSLCFALIAGCRPQIIFTGIVILPFLCKKIFKERQLYSRKTIKETIGFFAPFVLVAAGLMLYNYARFGSPFDFGANYNLTSNDMTKRGFVLDRCGFAVFSFFFQPVNFISVFPFFKFSTPINSYLGKTIGEGCYGGVFAANPFFALIFLPIALFKEFKKEKLVLLTASIFLIALLIGIFDAQGAGILNRYVYDFSFLLCIGACTAYLMLNRLFTSHSFKKISVALIAACIGWAVFYNFCLIFIDGSASILSDNPEFYLFVKHLVCFWL
jgi:hypothetical protein